MRAVPQRLTKARYALFDSAASMPRLTGCKPGIVCPILRRIRCGSAKVPSRAAHRDGNSAFVGKCEIVDDSSPLIRVAFDRNDAIGMRLQPLSISLEHGLLLRSNVVAIEGEMDVLYILFHCLLLRRSWNWRLRNGRIFYWPARIIFAVILVWNSRCSEVGLRKRYTDRQEGEQRSFHASTNHTDPRSRKALSIVSAKRRGEPSGQYRIDARMLTQSWAHISFRCRQI